MFYERPNRSKQIKSVLIIILVITAILIILVPVILVTSSFNRHYEDLSGEVKNLSVSVELLRMEIKDLKTQIDEIKLEQSVAEEKTEEIGEIVTEETLIFNNEEVDSSEIVTEEINVIYETFDGFPPIPAETPISELETNFIPGMDYRTITNHLSEQWAMQLQSTTNEFGARVYKGYICTAMATYYTHTVGDTFHVILNNGSEFDVICGEFKDDGTDPLFRGHRCRNYDKENAISVLEFIMDTPKLSSDVAQAGIFNKISFFGGIYGDGGNIISLEKTGHLDVDMSVLNI